MPPWLKSRLPPLPHARAGRRRDPRGASRCRGRSREAGIRGLGRRARQRCGLRRPGQVEDIDAAEWDKIFAVNCKGTFLFIKHVAPLMKSQRSGKIVNYSSKSGKTGSALMAP